MENREGLYDVNNTVGVSNFILLLRKRLVGCKFEKSFRIIDRTMITVTKVMPVNAKPFVLELHNDYILFNGKRNNWIRLNYDCAEEYIENFIEKNRTDKRRSKFKLLSR